MAAKKGKTTKRKAQKGKKAQNSHSFHDEVIILLTLAAALLLILSNFGIGEFSETQFLHFCLGSSDFRRILCRSCFFRDCFCIFK